MKIGVGLPNPVPGTPGPAVLEWARRAERRGFDAVATIDRIVYPSYDSLAAAAGATGRVELLSNILLAPLYPPALLAKSAASIDQLSGGRLTLGVAVAAPSPGARAGPPVGVDRPWRVRSCSRSATPGNRPAVPDSHASPR